MNKDKNAHEFDETTDSAPTRSAFDADGLDDFLHGMHSTTETGERSGMPSLEWIKTNFKTKSGAIRYLHQQGYSPQQISAHLRVKYQHAYNVCNQHLKRGPNEVYIQKEWQCSHIHAPVIVDVVVRRGERDPDSTRVLYRVCSACAVGLIPGVTDEALERVLPGKVTK